MTRQIFGQYALVYSLTAAGVCIYDCIIVMHHMIQKGVSHEARDTA